MGFYPSTTLANLQRNNVQRTTYSLQYTVSQLALMTMLLGSLDEIDRAD